MESFSKMSSLNLRRTFKARRTRLVAAGEVV